MTSDDVARITGQFFLEDGPGRRRVLSAFWTLLLLSAVIASAGVIGDSTATVIGAMIVAPLMRPILGTACAVVLARRRQIVTNLSLTVAGALSVIAVGYVLGLMTQLDVVAATNSQVAGRVSPRLIDLVAALATGVVGAFAVVRSDVSDTLPGVAIAISLVPPLAVVGLTLESHAVGEAVGALLLFGTNVAAIIATGTVVLLAAGLRDAVRSSGGVLGELTGQTLAVVLASVVLVSVPLALGSRNVLREELAIRDVRPVAEQWASERSWEVSDVSMRSGEVHVVAIGTRPQPDPQDLRDALDEAGLEDLDVEVTLIEGGSVDLPLGS